jgi:surface protein
MALRIKETLQGRVSNADVADKLSQGKGSASQPVYVDSTGTVQPITGVISNTAAAAQKTTGTLTLKTKGETDSSTAEKVVFNGSSDVAATITYSDVGASPASHNHDGTYFRTDSNVEIKNNQTKWSGGRKWNETPLHFKDSSNGTTLSEGGYHPLIGVSSFDGSVVNFGGYKNDVGFYGYTATSDPDVNIYTWKFTVDASSGDISSSNRISAPTFEGLATKSNGLYTGATDKKAVAISAGTSKLPTYFNNGVPVATDETLDVSVTGNADTASKFLNSVNIAIEGSVTGSAEFDGSKDIKITTDTTHNHDDLYVLKAGGSEVYGTTTFMEILKLGSHSTSQVNVKGSGKILVNDVRSATIVPTDIANGVNYFFSSTDMPTNNFYGLMHMSGWSGSNYLSWQLAGPANNGSSGDLYYRDGKGSGWNDWRKVLDAGNYNSYAPTLDGKNAKGTWGISISGNAATSSVSDSLSEDISIALDGNVKGTVGAINSGSNAVIDANMQWVVYDEGGDSGGNSNPIDPDTPVTYSDKLMKGSMLNMAIPNAVTAIAFTSTVPSDYTDNNFIDLSEAQDYGVVGWLDGTTFKIAQRKGNKIYANEDMSLMCYNKPITSFTLSSTGLLVMTNTTSVKQMFAGTALTSFDFNLFNLTESTSKIYNYESMFEGCTKLKTVTFRYNFLKSTAYKDGSYYAINLKNMFKTCSLLTTLTNFKTYFVLDSTLATTTTLDTSGMFYSCSSLKSIDFSSVSTISMITDMSDMFNGCSSLRRIFSDNDIEETTLDNVYKANTFLNCTSLRGNDCPYSAQHTSGSYLAQVGYITKQTYKVYLFADSDLDVTGMDLTTKSLWLDQSSFLSDTSVTASISLPTTKTGQIWTVSNLELDGLEATGNSSTGVWKLYFYLDKDINDASVHLEAKETSGDSGGTEGDGGGSATINTYIDKSKIRQIVGTDTTSVVFTDTYNTSATGATDVSDDNDGTAYAWTSGTTVYIAPVNSSYKLKAKSLFDGVFSYRTSLKSVDFGSLDTSEVTSMASLFEGCSSLQTVKMDNFDTTNLTNMYAMFYYCSSLTTLDLSSWTFYNIVNNTMAFAYCSALTTIYVKSEVWVTLSSYTSTFQNCTSLVSPTKSYDANDIDGIYMRTADGYLTPKDGNTGGDDGSGDIEYDKVAEPYTMKNFALEYALEGSVTGEDPDMTPQEALMATAEYIDFTTTIPDDVSPLDFSEGEDGTVLGWTTTNDDGNVTLYFAPKDGDTIKAPKNCMFLFIHCAQTLYGIDFSSGIFDTSQTYSMSGMFANCMMLVSFSFKGLNTSNVTDFSNMFFYAGLAQDAFCIDFEDFSTGTATTWNDYIRDLNSTLAKYGYTPDDIIASNSYLPRKREVLNNGYSGLILYDGMFLFCGAKRFKNFNNFTIPENSSVLYSLGSNWGPDFIHDDSANDDTGSGTFAGMYRLTYLDLTGVRSLNNVVGMNYLLAVAYNLTTIYCSVDLISTIKSTWPLLHPQLFYDVFTNATSLKGKIAYDESKTDASYLSFDGYLTEGVPSYYEGRTPIYISMMQCQSLFDNYIKEIIFLDELPIKAMLSTTVIDYVEVDEAGEGSLVGFTTYYPGSTVYKSLYFAPLSGDAYLKAPTSMQGFFYKTSLTYWLEKIDMGHLDTSDTTNFYSLFQGLSKLIDLNISNLNTSKLTTMDSAFYRCSKLETLDFTNWDFSSLTSITGAFGGCSSLKTIYVSSNFSAPSLPTTQGSVFYSCTNLSSPTMSYSSSYTSSAYFSITKGYLTPVDASGVAAIGEHSHEISPMINMVEMYNNKGLEWEAFVNNENSLPTKLIFTKTIPPEDANCFDLSANSDKSVLCWIVNEDEQRYIYVAEKNGGIIEAPEDMAYFFSVFDGVGLFSSGSIISIEIEEESLDTSSVISMGAACQSLSALKEFTFKNLDTSSVCSFIAMFLACNNLEKIDFENFTVGDGSLYSSYKENLVPEENERVYTMILNAFTTMRDFYVEFCKESYSEIYTEEQLIALFGTDEQLQAQAKEAVASDFYPYYLISGDKTYLPETIPDYNFILFDGMFCNCTNLTELVNVENFEIGSNTSIRYSLGSPYGLYYAEDCCHGLFERCSSLKEISLPNVDFRYVIGCYNLFKGCTSLEKIYTDHDWSLSYIYEPIGYTEYGILPDTFPGVTEENNYPGYLSFEDHLTSIYPFMVNPTIWYYEQLNKGVAESDIDTSFLDVCKEATTVQFAATVPTDKDLVDLSADQDGRVVGWISSDNVLTICTNEGKIKAPQNMSLFGFYFYQLTNIKFTNIFDTSDTYSMACAFCNSSLTNFSFSALNVKNVTDFNGMFAASKALTSVYMTTTECGTATSWDRYKKFLDLVDDKTNSLNEFTDYFPLYREELNEHISGSNGYVFFDGMFTQCYGLTSLNTFKITKDDSRNVKISLGSTDYQKAVYNYGVFGMCSALKTITLNWSTLENVTDFSKLFYMDSALTTIYSKVDLYSTYKGSTVPTKVFYSCKALVGNGSSYSSSNVSGDALSFANYLTEIQYAVA